MPGTGVRTEPSEYNLICQQDYSISSVYVKDQGFPFCCYVAVISSCRQNQKIPALKAVSHIYAVAGTVVSTFATHTHTHTQKKKQIHLSSTTASFIKLSFQTFCFKFIACIFSETVISECPSRDIMCKSG
jgi:hypothetical protein